MTKLLPVICLLCLLSQSSLLHSLTLTHPSDITALKSFKSSISTSSIPSYSCLATWDFSSTDPCSQPRKTKFTCALQCDAVSSPSSFHHRITHITLDPAGYSGTLSPLISLLTHLITLDLSENKFRGAIPPSIFNLPSLETLVLRSNSFSGSVSNLSKLKNVQTIDLSLNSFSGSLVNNSGLGVLGNLRRFDGSFNGFSGGIPELPPNLLELALKGNSLSGALARASFAKSTQLEVVELAGNSISGTLEHWFFDLPSLQQVDLANNSLTGIEIRKPSNPSNNALIAVDLGFNNIEGTIPENFSTYPILSSLSLRYNRLRGPIPFGISKKGTSIKRLFLDGNFLNGVPPMELLKSVSGSLGDNCLDRCPISSEMCSKSQKPTSLCRQAYGGKGKPRS